MINCAPPLSKSVLSLIDQVTTLRQGHYSVITDTSIMFNIVLRSIRTHSSFSMTSTITISKSNFCCLYPFDYRVLVFLKHRK